MPGSAPRARGNPQSPPDSRSSWRDPADTSEHRLLGEGPAVFPRFPVVPGQPRKPPLCSVSIQTPGPEVLAAGQGPAQPSLGISERHPPFQPCLTGRSWGLVLTGHRDHAMVTASPKVLPRVSPCSLLLQPAHILASLRWSWSVVVCFILFSRCLGHGERSGREHPYTCSCRWLGR